MNNETYVRHQAYLDAHRAGGKTPYLPLPRDEWPALHDAYQNYCLTHSIIHPPLLAYQASADSAAYVKIQGHPIIALGPHLLDQSRYSVIEILSVIAHEMGHAFDPSRFNRAAEEQFSDRFMAVTMGSVGPFCRFLDKFHSDRKQWLRNDLISDDEVSRRLAHGTQTDLHQQNIKLYGTLDERKQRLAGIDTEKERPRILRIIQQRRHLIPPAEKTYALLEENRLRAASDTPQPPPVSVCSSVTMDGLTHESGPVIARSSP